MARDAGRAAEEVNLVVRANCHLTDEPEPSGRAAFAGSIDQLVDDTKAVEALEAAEIFFDVQHSPNVNTTSDVIERMEHIWAALH
jgi:hypothetical protein